MTSEPTENLTYARNVLALAITAGFFGALVAVVFLAADAKDVLLMMVGALISAFSTVIGWFFGSSSGSDHKTKLLGEIADKNSVAAEVAGAAILPSERIPEAVSAAVEARVQDQAKEEIKG